MEENNMRMRDIKTLLELAEQNDYEAQIDLAYCYAVGDGVEKNIVEAIRWWEKLAYITIPDDNEREYTEEEYDVYDAARGYMDIAWYELGCCYYEGKGVEQDFQRNLKQKKKLI